MGVGGQGGLQLPLLVLVPHTYKRLGYSNRAVGNLRKAHRVVKKVV